MDSRLLENGLLVAPQITVDDMDELLAMGVKTLICNRPDCEEVGQPEFGEIEKAAQTKGIRAIFMPVNAQTMGPQAAQQFGELISSNEQPILAYCRTGTRCTTLWSINALMSGRSGEEVVKIAAAAGYDMASLASNFVAR